MADQNVLSLVENAGQHMTIEEGFAFIERSRRQLDRFAIACAPEGRRIVPAFEAQMRSRLDNLESQLRTEQAAF